MNKLKNLFFLFVIPLMAFTTAHKFYVSVTQMEYIEKKKELQIISRIFVDDLEQLIRERYDEHITLSATNESEKVNMYIERYLKEKMGITINGEVKSLTFLGKEYEDFYVIIFLEISDIESIESIEISNSVLFDLFEEQQNIVRSKINSKKKTFLFVKGNDKGLLNFN